MTKKPPRRRHAIHGTRSRYVAGCHCPKCRRANATYIKAARIRRAARRQARARAIAAGMRKARHRRPEH